MHRAAVSSPPTAAAADTHLTHCVSFNARSLNNKLLELHRLLADRPSVVSITETWLKPDTPDNLLTDSGNYSVYRRDRLDRRGGGVCMLVDNNVFQSANVQIPCKYDSLEIIAVDLLNVHFTCRFITVYRPPSSDTDFEAVQYCNLLSECIEFLCRSNLTVVITGDINVHNLQNLSQNTYSCSNVISTLFTKHAFSQFVTSPTRYNSSSGTESLLDLVLCNDDNFVFNTTVGAPFDISDHCMVSFDILKPIITPVNPHQGTYDFKRANWAAICTFLNNVDFFTTFSNCETAEECFDCFYTVLNECIAANVPFITLSSRSNRYPAAIRRNLTRKRAAWRTYKCSRSADALQRYKKLASVYRSSVYEYNVSRERKIIDSGNLSSFYRYCNRKFSSKTVIGPLRSPNGSMELGSQGKAELFQKIFSSYYTQDNNHCPPISPYISASLSHITFTPTLVNRAVKRLRTNSKGGPDFLPPEFIKRCGLWLSAPLSFLFQTSFDQSYIPPVWLTAHVCPIFKKGDRSDPGNYRPISLTCVLCKLMEHIIKTQLTSYLLSKNLITKQQHAFIARHSTITNLLECTRDWNMSLNSKYCVDIVYVDYRRAFDSIVHSKLLLKLSCFGFCGKLLEWLTVFLSHRSQQVVIENCVSSCTFVVSGVVQGSVLGPILFILYVNDIPLQARASVKLQLFADDLKLYSNISISPLQPSSHPLQQALDTIVKWSTEWQLTINVSKCMCKRLKPSSAHSNTPQYTINGTPLTVSSHVKDLGIVVDDHLSYADHISEITSKANQRVGILFRGFLTRDLNLLRRAFVTYVRPILEYGTVLWSPTLKKYIDQIENVQRRFTKRIPEISELPYFERLKRLNLETLEVRRLRFDLVYYFKILHNLTPHDSNDFFSFHHPPTTLRDNTPLIEIPTKGNRSFFSSFRYRAATCWNNLSPQIKLTDCLAKFKKLLFSLDLTPFLYGTSYTDSLAGTIIA